MLDTDTKRRIDSCRDILVGKVPDPKSQVEQITIALIYKFMDDMDAEAEELGGKRSFFAGEYAKYGWARLMAPTLGGFDVLTLYSEAIGKMTENPGIPPLFRDIFKNAYLPYRDPETLRAFLKEIDWFDYDHSEKLGDAFEYLLSVLGSQGDAGQFRTPRHIIDFMVEIVDPQKHESILDPACGTAGFLISAWKHILKHNSSPSPLAGEGRGEGAAQRAGDQLTPDERKHLATGIHGYDISPDMVRLSLVNMYLHGFTDPHIVEYDTLTSEEKWNETADVILANPPFMSPKGGIKPHKRFGIHAKRSEVLFVDYMAEHLTPTGRAGIIVPEGIIFQSQTAYKALRKMLVANSLVAVVSLPAGVFNPYAGVKTSILILDKSLARRSDTIAFFKVENDGYGLGAQRRAIDRNDLPQVKAELAEYLGVLRSGQAVDELQPTCGLIVAKEKIAANGEYNLSGERYREGSISTSTFPLVELGEICELVRGVVFAKGDEVSEGGVKVLRANNINKDRYELNLDDIKQVSPKVNFSDEKKLRQGDIFICLASGSKDHIGKVALIKEDTDFYFGGFMGAIRVKPGRLNARYLLKLLTTGHFNDFLREQIAGANINNLSGGLLYRFQIPLPPLEVQKEIVAEINGYQKVIDGARAVLDHYRPHIPIHCDWPIVQLSEICSFKNGLNFDKTSSGYTVKIIGVSDFQTNLFAPLDDLDEVHLAAPLADDYLVKGGDILFVRSNGNPDLVGRSVIVPPPREPTTFSGFTIRGRIEDAQAMPIFYAHFFKSRDFAEMIKTVGRGANIRNLSQGILNELKVPLPPLATQQAIVAEIEAEQALVAANRELIVRFEKKIQATLARVWGEDAPAPAET